MSRLYLRCGICGRQQADGLLSRGYWGHIEVADKVTLSACPQCKESNADWEQRLVGGGSAASTNGSAHRTA